MRSFLFREQNIEGLARLNAFADIASLCTITLRRGSAHFCEYASENS